jgi:oxalate decarboxylase
VSVIDRTIDFQYGKVTMMSDQTKERSLMEHPSRRSFLGLSSVALATAAFARLTANAQEKASTQKAEHDHSTSDPGPENKVLLGENPDSNNPPPTDHGDVGPIWYSFDLVKKRVEEGGWTHEVTQRVLPSSKDIAGVQMRLTAGSYREMHWHTADEWAYVLYGNARVTVMNPDGTMFIGDVGEGDLWIFPAGYPHSIQGAWSGWDGVFAGFQPGDVLRRRNHASLGDGGAHTSRSIVKEYRPG